MTQIQEGEAVPQEQFEQHLAQLEARTAQSWLIDTGRTVTVRARFFHPVGAPQNFIKERVLLQGQWGRISEEAGADSFLYEIEVNGTFEIRPWLRSFGSSCEVLEPLHLRKEMIDEWKEIAGYYESV